MHEQPEPRLARRLTGIRGLDEVTHGGLPRRGAVLVIGEPGAGKTVLGLQILARATERGEGGVLVSFEESRSQIHRSADSFSWGHLLHDSPRCEIVDARRVRQSGISGGFDLEGLFVMLAHWAARVDGGWVVLDGIDQLLRLHPDARAAVEQIARLDEWCEEHGLTAVLTGKSSVPGTPRAEFLDGIEYTAASAIAPCRWSSRVVPRTPTRCASCWCRPRASHWPMSTNSVRRCC